jgi:hypothetical protein
MPISSRWRRLLVSTDRSLSERRSVLDSYKCLSIASLALCLAACSKADDPNVYAKLIQGQLEFRTAIAVSYGPDASSVYNDAITRQISGPLTTRCIGVSGIDGQTENFRGDLKPTWKQEAPLLGGADALLWDWGGVDFSVVNSTANGAVQRYACPVFNDNFRKLVQRLQAAASAKNISVSLPSADVSRTSVPIAYRTNMRITYMKQYTTDIPMKGNTVVRAATCEFEIDVLNEELSVPSHGICAGKWYLDNDTGTWTAQSFEIHDPDILIGWHASSQHARPQ